MRIKYPHFTKKPDIAGTIGEHAPEAKGDTRAYSWMYTVSDHINSLAQAGMHIEFFVSA